MAEDQAETMHEDDDRSSWIETLWQNMSPEWQAEWLHLSSAASAGESAAGSPAVQPAAPGTTAAAVDPAAGSSPAAPAAAAATKQQKAAESPAAAPATGSPSPGPQSPSFPAKKRLAEGKLLPEHGGLHRGAKSPTRGHKEAGATPVDAAAQSGFDGDDNRASFTSDLFGASLGSGSIRDSTRQHWAAAAADRTGDARSSQQPGSSGPGSPMDAGPTSPASPRLPSGAGDDSTGQPSAAAQVMVEELAALLPSPGAGEYFQNKILPKGAKRATRASSHATTSPAAGGALAVAPTAGVGRRCYLPALNLGTGTSGSAMPQDAPAAVAAAAVKLAAGNNSGAADAAAKVSSGGSGTAVAAEPNGSSSGHGTAAAAATSLEEPCPEGPPANSAAAAPPPQAAMAAAAAPAVAPVSDSGPAEQRLFQLHGSQADREKMDMLLQAAAASAAQHAPAAVAAGQGCPELLSSRHLLQLLQLGSPDILALLQLRPEAAQQMANMAVFDDSDHPVFKASTVLEDNDLVTSTLKQMVLVSGLQLVFGTLSPSRLADSMLAAVRANSTPPSMSFSYAAAAGPGGKGLLQVFWAAHKLLLEELDAGIKLDPSSRASPDQQLCAAVERLSVLAEACGRIYNLCITAKPGATVLLLHYAAAAYVDEGILAIANQLEGSRSDQGASSVPRAPPAAGGGAAGGASGLRLPPPGSVTAGQKQAAAAVAAGPLALATAKGPQAVESPVPRVRRRPRSPATTGEPRDDTAVTAADRVARPGSVAQADSGVLQLPPRPGPVSAVGAAPVGPKAAAAAVGRPSRLVPSPAASVQGTGHASGGTTMPAALTVLQAGGGAGAVDVPTKSQASARARGPSASPAAALAAQTGIDLQHVASAKGAALLPAGTAAARNTVLPAAAAAAAAAAPSAKMTPPSSMANPAAASCGMNPAGQHARSHTAAAVAAAAPAPAAPAGSGSQATEGSSEEPSMQEWLQERQSTSCAISGGEVQGRPTGLARHSLMEANSMDQAAASWSTLVAALQKQPVDASALPAAQAGLRQRFQQAQDAAEQQQDSPGGGDTMYGPQLQQQHFSTGSGKQHAAASHEHRAAAAACAGQLVSTTQVHHTQQPMDQSAALRLSAGHTAERKGQAGQQQLQDGGHPGAASSLPLRAKPARAWLPTGYGSASHLLGKQALQPPPPPPPPQPLGAWATLGSTAQ